MAAITYNHTTGATLYAQFFNSDGEVWNGASFETPVNANWATYDVALSENGTTGIYTVTVPATVVTGYYGFTIYEQAGGSPAVGDEDVATGESGEATAALSDYDPPTKTEMDSAFTEIKGATFDNSTDSLEAIRDRGDAAWISGSAQIGSGAIETTITINDSGGNPIDGVEVWISTDSAGSNVVAGTLSTDAFGNVTFMLDSGTYYRWAQLSGYTFVNPVAFTVS